MKHSSRICETGSQAKSWSKKSSSTDTGIDLGERGLPGSIWAFSHWRLGIKKELITRFYLPCFYLFILGIGTPVSTWTNDTQDTVAIHVVICSYGTMYSQSAFECPTMFLYNSLQARAGKLIWLFMGPPEWTIAHIDWIIHCVSREPSNNHW